MDDFVYKVITPEERAAHKAKQAQKVKKAQAILQKERQKADADQLSRKHLQGLRVVQKNLVYVTGLSPTSQEDQLLQTLRGDQYFGQYGKIIKIVVSKAKDPSHPGSVGVYVTYERKEDAANCIEAVNNSKNGDRTLRAQCGTTKYCSAYLRNETCSNRNCMFLHEPGEANESYSRADLSALNVGSTQQEGEEARPPPPQSLQPMAASSQPMARQRSEDGPAIERPALPSTASWASKPMQMQHQGRANESRSTSGTHESPGRTNTTTPAPPSVPETPLPERTQTSPKSAAPPVEPLLASPPAIHRPKPKPSAFAGLIKNFDPSALSFSFSLTTLSDADQEIVKNYPPLFDLHGGAKRRLRRQREEEQRLREEEARELAFQQQQLSLVAAGADDDDEEQDESMEMSGSLQLGGEPEERAGAVSRPPVQETGIGRLDQRFQFGGAAATNGQDALSSNSAHQQMLLQGLKSTNEQVPASSFLGQQQQSSTLNTAAPPGHQRNVSRFAFANGDAAKPKAPTTTTNSQASSIPPSLGFTQQQAQFYTPSSAASGPPPTTLAPPPGLRTTGTPPTVSGGMTFGQGHGFATGGLQGQYGGGAGNEEMLRTLLRNREGSLANSAASSGGGREAAEGERKRELSNFPSQQQQQQQSMSMQGRGGFVSPPPNLHPAYAHQQQQAYSNSSFSAGSDDGKLRGKKKGKKHSSGRGGGGGSSVSSGADDHFHANMPSAHAQARLPGGYGAGLHHHGSVYGGGGGGVQNGYGNGNGRW